MPSYEDILNGGLQDETADSYAEMLGSEAGNTSPSQDPPFYITAYGLAVRAGFRGTLAEWLISLIGPKGDDAELRYDVESQALQWKQSDETEWKTLLTLADLQGDVVAQTLAAAEEATKHAPRISAANHWEIWNAQLGVYEDTGVEATGPEGKQGIQGIQGIQGPVGPTGAAFSYDMFTAEQLEALRGPQGIQGIQGPIGQTGEPGPQGEKGDKGDKGDPGEDGTDGEDGLPGEDGADGQRGTGILAVTTAPSSYTTTLQTQNPDGSVSTYTPSYRIYIPTVKSQSGVSEVLLGDIIQYSYYHYRVAYISGSYAYMSTRTSIRGENGERGTGILKVNTAPTSYTTAIGDYTPKYRIAISTVRSQAEVDEVLIGDIIQNSYYLYHVDYLDATYAYISVSRVSIRGPAGSDGMDGADGADGESEYITSVGYQYSNEDGGENTVTLHTSRGRSLPFKVKNGSKGATGEVGPAGPQGESIANVTSYSDPLDADNNLIAFYLGTGQQVGIIGVRNGSKGDKGDKGDPGADGKDGAAGADGQDGAAGKDGITPHIGTNGNWYIGTTDTGVAAAGPAGADGKDGATGPQGPAGATGAAGKDGVDGQRGTGILKVTTAPSSYTTAIGDYTPKYRIALSTVTGQSGVDEVLIGDVIQYSYYQYLVDYLDGTYAYTSVTRTSLRGATGAAGAAGADGADGATPAEVIAAMSKETWTFTLEDGSTVQKVVPLV